MERIFLVKSDIGCRKGCHPVFALYAHKGQIEQRQWFSIDEPGAWFEDKWNCHVDGVDYEFATRDEAIRWGIHVWDSECDYRVYFEE